MYESELLKLKEKVFAQLHKMPDGNDYQQITPMVNEWLVQAYNLGKSARYRAAKAGDVRPGPYQSQRRGKRQDLL